MISYRPINTLADLPDAVRLINLMYNEPISESRLAELWQPEPDELRMRRLAEQAGEVVGVLGVKRSAWMKPGHIDMLLVVEPAWRRQGIGAHLLEQALQFCADQGLTCLNCDIRDDDPASLHFAEQRGFRIKRKIFESVLPLQDFDEQPFLPYLERAHTAGLRFFSLADFDPLSDEHLHKHYELNRITGLDNPCNEGAFPPFEDFKRYVYDASWFFPAGQILAARGEEWVGMAAIADYTDAGYAYNAFTGVLAACRGQGLSYALKLLVIRPARQMGARNLRTDNDSLNAAMLAVNRKLGYQPQPGYYKLYLEL